MSRKGGTFCKKVKGSWGLVFLKWVCSPRAVLINYFVLRVIRILPFGDDTEMEQLKCLLAGTPTARSSRSAFRRTAYKMSRMVSPDATAPVIFRSGGRDRDQGRPVKLTPHFVATAEGSVLIEVGNTRVLCNATVQEGVPGWMRNSGRGWVTAEYGMLPRATLTRSPREAEKGKIGGRTHEIQRLIGRSLRSVMDMRKLGERTVILDCDVLQADGGTRTAAITGACTALALALGKLTAAGTLKESPLREMVAATSVGVVDGQVLLDLAYEEDSRAEVDMNVVMTASGGLVETQATAERETYSRAQLTEMLDIAERGIRELLQAQTQCLQADAA